MWHAAQHRGAGPGRPTRLKWPWVWLSDHRRTPQENRPNGSLAAHMLSQRENKASRRHILPVPLNHRVKL